MGTQTRLFQLLEYKDFYGEEKRIEDAVELIQNIPSTNLIHRIADFNTKIFLNDNNDLTGKIQFDCVDSLLGKCSDEIKLKWVSTIESLSKKFEPILIWNYSNLKFYDLIFSNYNNLKPRQLNSVDTKNIFDAYLIINQVVNAQTNTDDAYDLKNKSEEEIADFVVSKLMYQRDYMSSLDFRNQIERGEFFFEYLKTNEAFATLATDFLSNKGIVLEDEMFRVLLIIFGLCLGSIDVTKRSPVVDMKFFIDNNHINLDYLKSLCINRHIISYKEDISFLTIRNHFLFQLDEEKFIVLNVSFLFDHFFNSQVFAFHQHLKSINGKSDFLSVKAKDFMEDQYLPYVFNNCFPNDIKYFGEDLLSSSHEELCDGYIRKGNNIVLIEFKDVLLNARIKNSTNIEDIKNALNIKFESNDKGRPKGITQLANAVETIENLQIEFDLEFLNQNTVQIFPIILYTDNSFGQEGLNSMYRKKFQQQIDKLKLNKVITRDLIFINLSFFEMRSHYFNTDSLDFLHIVESYLTYITKEENYLTSFEVYARHYTNEQNIIDLPEPDVLSKYISL